MILRLSTSTIEDLSFDIGFTMELMVKMIVYDETMTLLWMVELFLARMSILEEIRKGSRKLQSRPSILDRFYNRIHDQNDVL